MGLTNKQQVFVEEYLKCWNATRAALAAGYSERTARSIGSENLTKPDISEEIQRRLKEKQLTADAVLARLGEQAMGNISEFAHIEKARDITALDNGYLIKKFDRDIITDQLGRQHEKISIELYNAQSALQLIGKHHGLLSSEHIVRVKVEKEIDTVLDALEQTLDDDTYSRVLAAISSGAAGADTTTETEESE